MAQDMLKLSRYMFSNVWRPGWQHAKGPVPSAPSATHHTETGACLFFSSQNLPKFSWRSTAHRSSAEWLQTCSRPGFRGEFSIRFLGYVCFEVLTLWDPSECPSRTQRTTGEDYGIESNCERVSKNITRRGQLCAASERKETFPCLEKTLQWNNLEIRPSLALSRQALVSSSSGRQGEDWIPRADSLILMSTYYSVIGTDVSGEQLLAPKDRMRFVPSCLIQAISSSRPCSRAANRTHKAGLCEKVPEGVQNVLWELSTWVGSMRRSVSTWCSLDLQFPSNCGWGSL